MTKSINLVILVSLLLLGCSSEIEPQLADNLLPLLAQEEGQKLPIGAKIILEEQVIELEVAQTPEQQRIGLMYRKSLDKNRGMIPAPLMALMLWLTK